MESEDLKRRAFELKVERMIWELAPKEEKEIENEGLFESVVERMLMEKRILNRNPWPLCSFFFSFCCL